MSRLFLCLFSLSFFILSPLSPRSISRAAGKFINCFLLCNLRLPGGHCSSWIVLRYIGCFYLFLLLFFSPPHPTKCLFLNTKYGLYLPTRVHKYKGRREIFFFFPVSHSFSIVLSVGYILRGAMTCELCCRIKMCYCV